MEFGLLTLNYSCRRWNCTLTGIWGRRRVRMNSLASSTTDFALAPKRLVCNLLPICLKPPQHLYYITFRETTYNQFITYSRAWFCEWTFSLAHSYNEYDIFDRIFGSVPIICIISWSLTIPIALNTIIARTPYDRKITTQFLSLIHIWRCRRSTLCRSRWSPYH